MTNKIKIKKKQTYRSSPFVNMTDDMIEVTLSMPINKYRELKKIIEDCNA